MFLSIQALLIWVAPFAVRFGAVGPLTPKRGGLRHRIETLR